MSETTYPCGTCDGQGRCPLCCRVTVNCECCHGTGRCGTCKGQGKVAPLRLRTKDHPQANGRHAKSGEHAWPWEIPLEDGRTLVIEMGGEGRDALAEIVMQSAADDIKEATKLNRQLVDARYDARVLAHAAGREGRCAAGHEAHREDCNNCRVLVETITRHAPGESPQEPVHG